VVVFPALLLNYLGQGAYLLSGAPVAGGKLFYSLAPAPLLLPLVAYYHPAEFALAHKR
jgi:KUP system potassium uptake protein